MDQAGMLRKMVRDDNRRKTMLENNHARKSAQGIAVASGKGGVGKTNIVANMALAIARTGKKVLVIDADVGLGNIHVLLGIVPKYTLQHVLDGERTIQEVLVKGPGGMNILPASSGGTYYSDLKTEEKITLKAELESLEYSYDYIFFDIGAGISKNVMYFCTVVNEIVIVCSSEPTSFADAYAIMKVLSRDYNRRDFRLIVNMTRNINEGLSIFNKLSKVAERFQLDIRIDYLGHILLDEDVTRSVREQKLFSEHFPQSKAAICLQSIVEDILAVENSAHLNWDRVLR